MRDLPFSFKTRIVTGQLIEWLVLKKSEIRQLLPTQLFVALHKHELLKREPLDAGAYAVVHYGSASLAANTRGGGSGTANRASLVP